MRNSLLLAATRHAMVLDRLRPRRPTCHGQHRKRPIGIRAECVVELNGVQMTSEHNRQALRPSAGGMITVKFADEIARLKSTAEWESADRQAVSLIKDEALNVLLMVLKKGAHLHEHRTKGPITVQMVSGAIRFSSGSDQRIISAGEMVGLDRAIPHSVEALEESALILVTAID
jgi:quercetin dioxygenase-like cupin family protein